MTTAGALIEAMRSLRCATRRVYFALRSATRQTKRSNFIRQCGIEVVNQAGFEKQLSSLEQNALTPQDAYRMGLKADHPQADLLVIACTDYRALEAVPALEQALGKPAVTSNSALMHACLKRLEVDMSGIEAGGCLFTARN